MKLNDGSTLRQINARDLIQIPIWNGNRIINFEHVKKIRESVRDVRNLDFAYRVIQYKDTDAAGNPIVSRCLIDGQHRYQVLKEYFAESPTAEDFAVIVVEKSVESELEVIDYFNKLNTTQPIQWTDRNLIINKYIFELEAAFNNCKKPCIRQGSTCRPYLSVTKLREVLKAVPANLLSAEDSSVRRFVELAEEHNTSLMCTVINDMLGDPKETDMIHKGRKLGFMLAIDKKLSWVQTLLRSY
jgi:hypothetical protein